MLLSYKVDRYGLGMAMLMRIMWMHSDSCAYVYMTAFQYRGKYQLQCVTANLTLHMMLKIEFQLDFFNPQVLSFPNV